MHAWQSILALVLGCQLVGADELMLPVAPLVTGARNLNVRQEQSCPETTQTRCSDGTGGCCPIDSVCTFFSGEPRCRGSCSGGHKCLAGGCCEAGYNCPSLGGKFCVPATSVGTLTIPSMTIGTADPSLTVTISEPTITSESTSQSRPSSTPEPTPTSTTSSDDDDDDDDSDSSSTASPSSVTGDSSDDASGSSSGTPSETVSPSDPSEFPGSAAPVTDSDMAGSLSVSWESWMALLMVVPFVL